MPELAEVEYFRRQWDAGLGKRIRETAVHSWTRVFRETDANALATALRGARLVTSISHGKRMLFRTDAGGWLGIHLGMTGSLRREPARHRPGRHDHLVLFQRGHALVFADPRQFGCIQFHAGESPPAWWSGLPAALTSKEFTPIAMESFLSRHARAPIKAVLLSQEAFPGVGNWMADEILWRAKVHPQRPSGRVAAEAGAALYRAVRFVCAGALRMIAPDYSDPPPSWLFRHRWEEGGRCPKDHVPLRRGTVGGRTTAWCPKCQGTVRGSKISS